MLFADFALAGWFWFCLVLFDCVCGFAGCFGYFDLVFDFVLSCCL